MNEKDTNSLVGDEINLLDLLQVIVSHKWFIIKMCFFAAILSIIYSLSLTKIYTATAKILPPQKESASGLSALLGQMGGLGGLAGGTLGIGGSSELYVAILKSRSVADAVIKKLLLDKEFMTSNQENLYNILKGIVKVQAGKDGIISISAEYKDPHMAAKLANQFVEELGRKSVQMNLIKAGNERVFLEKRLELVRYDLKKAEVDLKTFQEQHKTIKVDSQVSGTIQSIARLKAEIASKEVQLAALQSYQTDENNEIKLLKATLTKLRGQYSAMAGSGGDDVIPSMGNAPALGLEFLRKLRELKIQEAIFEQITKQYELAKINEAKDSSTIQVLDDAVTPLSRSKPRRAQIVILTTLSAFLVSICCVFVIEYLDKLPDEDKCKLNEIKASLYRWNGWKS